MAKYWVKIREELSWFAHGFVCVNWMSDTFPMVCSDPRHKERGF